MKKVLLMLVVLVSSYASAQNPDTAVTVVELEHNSQQWYLLTPPDLLSYNSPDNSRFTINGNNIVSFRDNVQTIVHSGNNFNINGVNYTDLSNQTGMFEQRHGDVPSLMWGETSQFGYTSFLVRVNADGTYSRFHSWERSEFDIFQGR